MKIVAERKRNENLERARALKSVKGGKIKRPPIPPYHPLKKYAIAPDLRRRRLLTLISYLEFGHDKRRHLTEREKVDWAKQCRNLL